VNILAVIGIAVGCLLALGFYGYVFLQLYREHRRFRSMAKRLDEHLLAPEPSPELKAVRTKTVLAPKVQRRARKETLLHVGVALGGLLGVFAEIGLLNWVVNSFH
jgi:hypothetical protein